MNNNVSRDPITFLERLQSNIDSSDNDVLLEIRNSIRTYSYLKELASAGIISICFAPSNLKETKKHHTRFESVNAKSLQVLEVSSPLPLLFDEAVEFIYRLVFYEEADDPKKQMS